VTAFDDTLHGRTSYVPPDRPAVTNPVAEEIGHYLLTIAGSEPGTRVEIGPESVTIGRDPHQTLVFADAELSRRHARIWLDGNVVMAADLGSMNGTFVDQTRLTRPLALREGDVLRLGSQLLKYERRSRRDVERNRELDCDLRKARSYVFSLLPPPLTTGPLLVEWCYVPSAQLGGDAFGYYWLDPGTFVMYLVDVSGHGVGPAMHSVSVLNVLRQRALPSVDFSNPAEVLSSLNNRFQMESHDGLYFTMWYGVYRTADRTLTYGSAGHHPAYLVAADRDAARPLGMPALMIGALPGQTYETAQATLPPGGVLYLFSDGVYEIVTKTQQRWSASDFLQLALRPPAPGTSEPDRLYQAVTEAAAGPLEDDFSLMVLTFL
jgi:serine phosphatase RsbU (regulator of sigma subunit)